MSSLWTPDGERPVGRPPSQPTAPAGTGPGPAPGAASGDPGMAGGGAARGPDDPPGGLPGDDRAAADEVARLRRELVQTPAAVVVANHAYGLFELAAIHLSEQPPNLAQAQVAVDAFGAVVETLGDRLGEAAAPLRDALAQLRLAFVQLSAAATAGPAGTSGPPDAPAAPGASGGGDAP